jgi:ATP-dependent DNA ligase
VPKRVRQRASGTNFQAGSIDLSAVSRDSRYETGLRSGAWQKMRVNRGQEFVIGGYTVGTKTFDAVVFGYYESDRLIYAARTRNGFTPVVREQLFRKFRGLETEDCPFVNLPEPRSGRWGAGLTAAEMKDCRWLKPVLVAQIEFLEWTGENHLRHTKFIALRDDKPVPRQNWIEPIAGRFSKRLSSRSSRQVLWSHPLFRASQARR